MPSYLRPLQLEDAVAALDARPRVVVAGGTDYYPARVGRPLDDEILDISALRALRAIEREAGQVRIGALVTWTDLRRAALPAWLDGLKLAAREVGGLQVQNAGTLGGNLCNASPAADGLPNLLVLDARVELTSARGVRVLPVAEFVTGNRQTARGPQELVTAILIPEPGAGSRATFLKLGARAYLVISIVMVAALLEPAADGTVAAARVAVGACSAVPKRLPGLEAELAGRPITAQLAACASARQLAGLAPIDDLRASAAYRRDAALSLVRRALAELAGALA